MQPERYQLFQHVYPMELRHGRPESANHPLSYLSASQKPLPVMRVGDRARKETENQTCDVSDTVGIRPQIPLQEAKRRSAPT